MAKVRLEVKYNGNKAEVEKFDVLDDPSVFKANFKECLERQKGSITFLEEGGSEITLILMNCSRIKIRTETKIKRKYQRRIKEEASE